ncbi:Na+/H+ antiporter NhaA [Sphingomonas antarctica]|uniref:Na+/H+ antiporter NhaA n=1 Tax=Sphingomonas antarctica TaxID=2040274 RepID=UPI0039ED8CAA
MRSALRHFLQTEAAGGIVLMGAAALALIVANSPLANAYFATLALKAGPLSVLHWINDALMAVFFFLVGLEIKREWTDGQLSRWGDRVLPGVAALAGMVVPAIVFLTIAGREPGLARGWAIPAATDIAFALGVLALAGKCVPASLKLFLTTVAIVDDIGAVVIIALFYSGALHWGALGGAAAILLAMFALNRAGVKALWPYLIGFLLLWIAVHESGVHATVAGVLAAFTVPVDRDDAVSPLHRLEHGLSPWVAFWIVPLFGFANAGVSLGGMTPSSIVAPLPLAIALGLFIGKQAGVFTGVRLSVALGIARKPEGARWRQVYGVALLCGVGFTMSLFIGGLAFADPAQGDAVKIGVLAGSILSALAGWALLRTPAKRAGG